MDKSELRKLALAYRAAVADPQQASDQIWERLRGAFSFSTRGWISCYVGVKSEVRTDRWLQDWFLSHKPNRPDRLGSPDHCKAPKIAVPVCVFAQRPLLELYHLRQWADLAPSKFGLLEPAEKFRTDLEQVQPSEIDLFLVPGLAFDRSGVRLGYGKGFYDQLLRQRSPQSTTIGLAFSGQVYETVPHDPRFDVPVDFVVTEREVIECRKPNP